MITIPVEATPNQSLSITIGGNLWGITLKECLGMMYASLTKNNVAVTNGVRCVSAGWLLPFDYLAAGGNFAFMTNEGEAPYYDQFGVTQSLVYFTADEIASA